MVVATDEKAEKLIQRDRLDELMRIDSGFRKTSAAYCILVTQMIAKDEMSNGDRKLLLNLQADMIYKSEILMEVSPSLRARAERHLRLLRQEVAQ